MNLRDLRIENCIRRVSDAITDSIDCPNAGGCAVIAVALVKRLVAIGESPKIRLYNYERVNINTAEEIVFNRNGNTLPSSMSLWRDVRVYFTHVAVEWNGRIWDSNSETPVEDAGIWETFYKLADGDISLAAMEALANTPSNWNNAFDRSQIPLIEDIMDNEFAEFFNEVFYEEAA